MCTQGLETNLYGDKVITRKAFNSELISLMDEFQRLQPE